jgi:DNA-binding NarL/FixJ family response regulator
MAEATADLKIVGEAAEVQDPVLEQTDYDVITLDGEAESLVFLHRQKKASSNKRPPSVLIISRCVEPQHVFQLLSAGADGYVSKRDSRSVVLGAIRKVGNGRKYLTPELSDALMVNIGDSQRPARLSQREYEVLFLVGSGLRSSEIADRLSLSIKTVSTYRSRLMEKLMARNTAELIKYAVREGIAV